MAILSEKSPNNDHRGSEQTPWSRSDRPTIDGSDIRARRVFQIASKP